VEGAVSNSLQDNSEGYISVSNNILGSDRNSEMSSYRLSTFSLNSKGGRASIRMGKDPEKEQFMSFEEWKGSKAKEANFQEHDSTNKVMQSC